jgi:hypothetical protein
MKHGICFDPYDGLTEVLEELHRGEIVSTDLEIAIQTANCRSPTREGELLHTTEAVTLHYVCNMGFNLLAFNQPPSHSRVLHNNRFGIQELSRQATIKLENNLWSRKGH